MHVQGSLWETDKGCWIVSVQLGNIIANNIYREDDKPQYRRGNGVLFAINLLGIVVFLLTKAYYIRRNQQRSRVWNAMTPEVSYNILHVIVSATGLSFWLTWILATTRIPGEYHGHRKQAAGFPFCALVASDWALRTESSVLQIILLCTWEWFGTFYAHTWAQ